MSSDLRELYQEMILDHSKHPHNTGPLECANRDAEGYNPLCGDKIKIHVRVEDGIVKDVRFEGVGCAISTASASLMTDALKGKTEAEVEALFHRFHDLVTGKASGDAERAGLGKLAVLSGVREFPVRVKCATLAWHTLRAALKQSDEVVTTE